MLHFTDFPSWPKRPRNRSGTCNSWVSCPSLVRAACKAWSNWATCHRVSTYWTSQRHAVFLNDQGDLLRQVAFDVNPISRQKETLAHVIFITQTSQVAPLHWETPVGPWQPSVHLWPGTFPIVSAMCKAAIISSAWHLVVSKVFQMNDKTHWLLIFQISSWSFQVLSMSQPALLHWWWLPTWVARSHSKQRTPHASRSPKRQLLRPQLSFDLCQLGLQGTLLGSSTSFNQLWKKKMSTSKRTKTRIQIPMCSKMFSCLCFGHFTVCLQRQNKQPQRVSNSQGQKKSTRTPQSRPSLERLVACNSRQKLRPLHKNQLLKCQNGINGSKHL